VSNFVQYALFVFFWLVAIVFHALLVLAYITSIMVAAMDYGELAVVITVVLGGIVVVVLRVLYGLAIPSAQSEQQAVWERATSIDGKSSIGVPGQWSIGLGIALPFLGWVAIFDLTDISIYTVISFVALLIVIPLWAAVFRLVIYLGQWLFSRWLQPLLRAFDLD
jgi:hypothetical protein